MVDIDLVYEGGLHCRLKHGPSGMEITTDAPKDNMGKGEAFSPTDLVTAGVVSCMVTTMAIFAARHNLVLEGMSARITKEMASDPRRIGRMPVTIEMPGGIEAPMRAALERAALTCPAHRSLAPDVQIPVNFKYA
jgi:putative redox protein